ncbi:MAG: T9SS C-terminal target domain-containing protein [Phycisphaerae bacterium]|nr:T9SS C-terminal target domain-containing protein [Phycisphaerae bacterium]
MFLQHLVLWTLIVLMIPAVCAGPFAPAAGQSGSTAIPMPEDPNDLSVFKAWASGIVLERGLAQINDPGSTIHVTHGVPDDALGFPQGQSIIGVVSLGDGGTAILTFDKPIANGPGDDFAIFENGFVVIAPNKMFLELAFVEVSSDGENFVRFPAVSLTQTETQIPNLGVIDTTDIHNLAGKYQMRYGTPFDLDDIRHISSLVDVTAITHVRIVDVVGTLLDDYASYDSEGNKINDPWTTKFSTGGFDLDAIGVIYEKTLSTDANGDGIVNLGDYAVFSTAYLSGPASTNWNYKCDVQPFIDDSIDINDILILMEQWLLTEEWYPD